MIVGDRVKMTPEGYRQFPQVKPESRKGVVTRVDPPFISVLRDGQKRPYTCVGNIWELDFDKEDTK